MASGFNTVLLSFALGKLENHAGVILGRQNLVVGTGEAEVCWLHYRMLWGNTLGGEQAGSHES